MHSNVLQIVLTIVTLSGGVIKVLGPDKNSVARWSWENLNVLSSWACDVELRSLQITIQIVDIHKTVVLRVREHFSVLPCHEVERSAWVVFHVCRSWAENKAIEFAVVNSIVFLDFAIQLWEWWKLGLNLHLWLLKVSILVYLNDVFANLPCAESFLLIELN